MVHPLVLLLAALALALGIDDLIGYVAALARRRP